MKKALILGAGGQDGSYLSKFLLSKGYEVYGFVRRSSSSDNTWRIKDILNHPNLKLVSGDLGDSSSLLQVVGDIHPDEVYNLAAMSHVRQSFDIPEYTADITGTAVVRILEAIRKGYSKAKFYQASSSEMFGKVLEIPQTEVTPFCPRSPYACAKVFAHYIVKNYRESYSLFGCNGILFNHEGPEMRSPDFVTRKITLAVARIKLGLQEELVLGNLDAKRDWGFAGDYIKGMYLMLQQDKPDDYVLATGEAHSVKEFVQEAFSLVDLDWEKYVRFDQQYCRPAEVDILLGDYSKAKRVLGWEPEVKFKQLVKMMVEKDLEIEGGRK